MTANKLILCYPPDGWPELTMGLALPETVVVVDVPKAPSPLEVERARDYLRQQATTGDVVVPLEEEAVTVVGWASVGHPYRCLDDLAAERATDRRAQRMRLPSDLNPTWAYFDGRIVAKRRASSLGLGVREVRLEPTPGADMAVHQLGLEGHGGHVLEEYIPGRQYEVSGILGPGGQVLHVFNVLWQEWAGSRIAEYHLETDHYITQYAASVALRAVKALGLEWCGFCAEVRGTPLKVIEVNARLGSEPNRPEYYELLSPGKHPALVLRDKLREVM